METDRMKLAQVLLVFVVVSRCKSTPSGSSNPGEVCLPDRLKYVLRTEPGDGPNPSDVHINVDFLRKLKAVENDRLKVIHDYNQRLRYSNCRQGPIAPDENMPQCLPASSFKSIGTFRRTSQAQPIQGRTYIESNKDNKRIEQTFTMDTPAMPIKREEYRNGMLLVTEWYLDVTEDVDDTVFRVPDHCGNSG